MRRLLLALTMFGLVACGAEPEAEDCAGVAGGDAVVDACGVCDGNGSSCADCAGVPNGNAVVDACGICVGGATGVSACEADCDGNYNTDTEAAAYLDECGQCVGGTTGLSACEADCNGDYNIDTEAAAYLDECGECVGGQTGQTACIIDCNGDRHDTYETAAYLDGCAECVGGLTGLEPCERDCNDVYGGGATLDACGVCDGDGSSCILDYFNLIEAGTFTMGFPESELGRGNAEAQRQVTLTNEFYLSDHEVTQAEWQALIGNNPSQKNNGTCDSCPVETVNWWEALHYANALSESEGLTACYVLEGCNGNAVGANKECTGVTLQDSSGNAVATPYECEGYRLPTEAEWEYAGRAGTTTAFYNGDITSETGADPNANEIAWYGENSGDTTHAVKGKLPNAWGLYDMSGNVSEWIWDWFEYNFATNAVTDPNGPSSGSERVLRGGSFYNSAMYVRVADRRSDPPGSRYSTIGFRLARSP